MLDTQWDESIQRTRASAERRAVFVEAREDLRVEAASGEEPEATHGFWAGAGAETADGRWCYLSDAQPDDLDRLLTGSPSAGGDPESISRESIRLDPSPALAAVTGAIVEAQRGCPNGRFQARWVEFSQEVRVGHGECVVSDCRRGRRFRIDGYLEAGDRVARATLEQVLDPNENCLASITIKLIERLERRLESADPTTGPTSVVFAPSIAGILIHELIGHPAEADRVIRGESWLTAGTDMFPKQLTVIDDPRRGRAPWRYDDEGVAARPTALIRDGRSRERLHTRATASNCNADPNGHGRRGSFRESILPRMGCTFIANGDHDPNQIVADIDEGIYVRRMESAHTDPATGRAIFRVTDSDRIVAGRIDGSLNAHLLETVAVEALAGIDSIGNDLAFDHCIGSCHRDGQPLATSVGGPTICIRLMTVRY